VFDPYSTHTYTLFSSDYNIKIVRYKINVFFGSLQLPYIHMQVWISDRPDRECEAINEGVGQFEKISNIKLYFSFFFVL
jgi:hypothetical protein